MGSNEKEDIKKKKKKLKKKKPHLEGEGPKEGSVRVCGGILYVSKRAVEGECGWDRDHRSNWEKQEI